MSFIYLFDNADPAATPADSEAVRLGAQRIRELKDMLQDYLGQIFDAAGDFIPGGIPGDAVDPTAFVNAAQSITKEMIVNATFGDGLLKATNGAVVTANLDPATLEFDGSTPKKIRVKSTIIAPPSASTRNLLMLNNVATPLSKLDITAEEVVLKSSTGVSFLASSVAVTVDMGLGVALNGIETGSIENVSRWYYVWLISDGTNVRGVFEDAGVGAGVAPAGPDLSGGAFTGYIYKALIGAVRNAASGNFDTLYQQDRMVWLNDAALFASVGTTTGYSPLSGAELATLQTLVPPNARRMRGSAGFTSGGAPGIYVSDGLTLAADANGLGACTINGEPAQTGTNGFVQAGFFEIPLKTPQLFYWKAADSTNHHRVKLSGYSF